MGASDTSSEQDQDEQHSEYRGFERSESDLIELLLEDNPWRDEKVLRKLYLEHRLVPREMAELLGCSRRNVSKWINRYDISRRSWSEIADERAPDLLSDPDALQRLYVDEHKSIKEIAAEADVSVEAVHRRLRKHDIDRRTKGMRENTRELRDSTFLYRKYVIEEKSTVEIAEEGEYSDKAVCYWLHEHGIETRPHVQPGEKNQSWAGGHEEYYGPNWDEQREKALDRDGYTCRDCGITQREVNEQHDRGLSVHHRVPLSSFAPLESAEDYYEANQLNNLLTLCTSCHNKWEALPVQPPAVVTDRDS